MTLLFLEDFAAASTSNNSGDLGAMGWSGGPLTLVSAPLAAGGTKTWLTLNNLLTSKTVPNTSPINAILFGFRVAASSTNTQFYLTLRQAATANPLSGVVDGCLLQDFDGTGVLRIYDGNSTLVATSAPGAIPYGTEFYFEVSCFLSFSGGNPIQSIVARVNGAVIVLAVNIACPTAGAGSTNWQTVAVEWPTNVGNQFITDLYLLDGIAQGSQANLWNLFLGPSSVNSYLPTTNGTVQFSPVGLGTNWQNASVVPMDPSTDYNINAGAASQTDYFPLGANPHGFVPVTVSAISSRTTATIPGTNTGTLTALVKNSIGTVATVATGTVTDNDFPVGTVAGCSISPPGVATPWTLADLSSCSYGYSWTGSAPNTAQVGQRLVLVLGTFALPGGPPGPRSSFIQ